MGGIRGRGLRGALEVLIKVIGFMLERETGKFEANPASSGSIGGWRCSNETGTFADIKRYRDDPVQFVDECLVNPATGRAYELLEAEKVFLRRAFQLDENGKAARAAAHLLRNQEERKD